MNGTSTPGKPTDVSVFIPHLDDPQSRPLMVKMARIFLQIGAMGEMEKFGREMRLPTLAKRLSKQAFRLYDQYLIYTTGRLQKKGWQVYCSPGCGSCCHSMPAGISTWEFLLIYDQLAQSGEVERFFRRNLESCQVLSRVRWRRSGEFLGRLRIHENGYDTVLHAYGMEQHPCAFLSDSQQCLIYSARPLPCRMHFALTPPELCSPTHPRFSQAVRLNLSPHADVQQALQRIDARLNLTISDLLAPGFVTLAANVMRFSAISWI
ncbi:MAG: YkgJ family cysteine cluster protein [Deltaproteobacteria bacterium]|nr:MAG: YkgJ family cysteine cluster protein [Deltaproteobacteria bacterium]